ncbi:MAG: hypothetical protein AAF636_12945 [Pseudomonadota bacterium]
MAQQGRPRKALAGGEKIYGFVVDFLPIRHKMDGAPVQFVFPDVSISAVTGPVAILSAAQNPDAAKAFVEFPILPEGQQLAVDMGYLPAHPAIEPSEGFPARAETNLFDFCPAAALAYNQSNKERFIEIFGG